MSDKIVIVDYGMGNLHSVSKAVAAVGGEPVVTSDKKIIAAAEKIILPGVGAFGDCMANMERFDLVPVIKNVMDSGRPFLGICLGLQMLFEGSDEAPGVKGLGYFKGYVKYLAVNDKIPHMGWNQLILKSPSPIMKDAGGEYVYFVHSYHAEPEDESIITSVCNYGKEITASIGRNNVQAVQFHPEKSSRTGLAILKSFKEWRL